MTGRLDLPSFTRIVNQSNERIANRAKELNSEVVPKRTGHLQESFKVEEQAMGLDMYWEAPYATYTDEGFPESEGRYVKAIEKRLVNKALSARQQVYKQALAVGYSKDVARAALTTPIRKVSWTTNLNGAYNVRDKIVEINKNRPVMKQQETIRHELWHAIEDKARTLSRPGFEKRAAIFGAAAGLRERNIGKHPGFKGHRFTNTFLDQLTKEATNIVLDIIAEELKK